MLNTQLDKDSKTNLIVVSSESQKAIPIYWLSTFPFNVVLRCSSWSKVRKRHGRPTDWTGRNNIVENLKESTIIVLELELARSQYIKLISPKLIVFL